MDAPSLRPPDVTSSTREDLKRETGKRGTVKNAWTENAGMENAAPNSVVSKNLSNSVAFDLPL